MRQTNGLENGFVATLRSKLNVVNNWNCHFSVFYKFLGSKVETVFSQSDKSVQYCSNQNSVVGSIFKNGFEATSSSTTNAMNVRECYFLVFCKFLSNEVGKVGQTINNCLNQNSVIKSFLENGFEVTLSSKTNVLRIWKRHFSVLCKFFSDKVENVTWESEGKRSKLFKSTFGHRKFLGKWFWSYLELKNECS